MYHPLIEVLQVVFLSLEGKEAAREETYQKRKFTVA